MKTKSANVPKKDMTIKISLKTYKKLVDTKKRIGVPIKRLVEEGIRLYQLTPR